MKPIKSVMTTSLQVPLAFHGPLQDCRCRRAPPHCTMAGRSGLHQLLLRTPLQLACGGAKGCDSRKSETTLCAACDTCDVLYVYMSVFKVDRHRIRML